MIELSEEINLPEKIVKTLPGEALVVISFAKTFVNQNLELLPTWQIQFAVVGSIIGVGILTFLLKYFATGIASTKKITLETRNKILYTIVSTIQAILYSLAIFNEFLIPEVLVVLITFLSFLAGFIFSVIGSIFPKKK